MQELPEILMQRRGEHLKIFFVKSSSFLISVGIFLLLTFPCLDGWKSNFHAHNQVGLYYASFLGFAALHIYNTENYCRHYPPAWVRTAM